MSNQTPLMAQYREIKGQHADCVLFFRVGDFYETFYEDAVEVARILNIALTTRDKKKPNPVPLAGVPFHAAETYITRLLAAGKKVAVCEQVEDASEAQGLVKREVVEVLTPGTAMNAQLLDERENNYCMAVFVDGERCGVAVVDVSTGDLSGGEGDLHTVQHLIQGKRVRELLCRKGKDRRALSYLVEILGDPFVTELDADLFEASAVNAALELQFGAADTGIPAMRSHERIAAGALLAHCQALRGGALPQVSVMNRLAEINFLALDDETIRNLELFEPLIGGDSRATLIRHIDRTVTPMGAREIRLWLQKPLYDSDLIDRRLDGVSEIYASTDLQEAFGTILKGVRDIERLGARIATKKAIPRELHALRESLERLPELISALQGCDSTILRELLGRMKDHASLAETIGRAIVDDPPGHLRDGGVIRKGFSPAVDELIDRNEEAKIWIANLERREKARTGISSLKVGFNKVFGYYIEVSKAHRASVPDEYVGKQTLVNAERYYTKDLKDREQSILESVEKRIALEQTAFDSLCNEITQSLESLQTTAHAVGQVDVLQALAASAREHRFRRPVVDDSKTLDIVAGRHPVIEKLVSEAFVSNDLYLDVDKKQFALITGPNMSGKSTFLRQTALIVILAQMGSFVPADRARIGLVDSVSTRVGASDRLSRGESTFLVEMQETATILATMTDRSLVLLDEVGRGTSTYDGLSIAWAVTEYLLQGIKARPKTLFATHFHELTQLRSEYPRLVNLKITIKEWEGGIIFLRKIVTGTSDRSYGIHAARVAGMPPQVLKRAEEILHTLELRRDLIRQGVTLTGDDRQRSLFHPAPSRPEASSKPASDPIHDAIRDFQEDSSTPLEALQLISALKDRLRQG